MTKDQLTKNIKKVLDDQLLNMANNNKAIGFFKPLLNQLIDKNVHKVDKYLDLFADKEGTLDLSDAINQMASNVINMEPFKINVPVLDEVEIGGGFIKFQIPMINKAVSFDANDLENFRRTLLNINDYEQGIN